MKKTALLTTLLGISTAAFAGETAIYDLPNSKLHVYASGDAMGDVSFIIEGKKSLIVLEQPPFFKDIEEFGDYTKSLKKPIAKVLANYHSGGLSPYSADQILMPAKMPAFMASPKAQGMLKKFQGEFGDAADFALKTGVKTFDVPSAQKFAGVNFKFSEGVKSDFPAASVQIDGKAFYSHFAPAIAHANPMQIRSIEAIDFQIAELQKMQNSGAELFFGSHGGNKASKIDAVNFQLDYLKTLKKLRAETDDSATFIQKLIAKYPTLNGAEKLKKVAANIYPNEVVSAEKEAVRKRVFDYLNVVSNLDEKLAADLWLDSPNVSIITPRAQFFGPESIMNDFLLKAFSSMKSRKLSSLCEVINVYGDSATVQLYWVFDTIDAKGEAHQTRGRESLIFTKTNEQWKLNHVHYSRLPQ